MQAGWSIAVHWPPDIFESVPLLLLALCFALCRTAELNLQQLRRLIYQLVIYTQSLSKPCLCINISIKRIDHGSAEQYHKRIKWNTCFHAQIKPDFEKCGHQTKRMREGIRGDKKDSRSGDFQRFVFSSSRLRTESTTCSPVGSLSGVLQQSRKVTGRWPAAPADTRSAVKSRVGCHIHSDVLCGFPCMKTEGSALTAVNQTQATSIVCLKAFQRIIKIESTPVDTASQPSSGNCGSKPGRTSETTLSCSLTTPSLSARRSPPARCLPAGRPATGVILSS